MLLINVDGGQDERVKLNFVKEGADFLQGVLRIQNATVQSQALFKSAVSMTYSNCTVVSGETDCLLHDQAGAGAFVYLEDNYFENRILGTPTILGTHNAESFTGNSRVVYRRDRNDNKTSYAYFTDYKLHTDFNYTASTIPTPFGNATKPIFRVGDNSTGHSLLQLGSWNGSQFYGHSYYHGSAGDELGKTVSEGNQAKPYSNRVFKNIDVEADAVILKSANGTRYKVVPSDDGTALLLSRY